MTPSPPGPQPWSQECHNKVLAHQQLDLAEMDHPLKGVHIEIPKWQVRGHSSEGLEGPGGGQDLCIANNQASDERCTNSLIHAAQKRRAPCLQSMCKNQPCLSGNLELPQTWDTRPGARTGPTADRRA